MDINQRDMLVGQIRSGYIYLSRNIKLKPMSIDLFNESMFVYQDEEDTLKKNMKRKK